MRYFGPLCSPPSPECGDKVQAPVGLDCFYCDVPVKEGDSGFILPFMSEDGESDAPYHRDCLKAALGLVDVTPTSA